MKGILLNIFWMILTCFTTVSCKLNPLEDSVNNIEEADPDSGIIMINSSSLAEYETIIKDNIVYKVCKDKSDSIIFIRTKSKSFKTSNYIKVGMHLSEVLNKTENLLSEDPGWAFVIPLKNGWYAGFGLSEDGYDMANDSIVKFIFRRNDFPLME